MTATLSALHLFPLKSCAPLVVAEAVVTPRGLLHDRRWMAVDSAGRFLTGRKHPRLTLIRATPSAAGLDLCAPAMPDLALVAAPERERIDVTVWDSQVSASAAPLAADAWISQFLGIPARLVHMADDCLRPVSPTHSQPGDVVSFADGYPLLLISQAALDQLNQRLATPVPMLRFRPNLVIANTAPHAEDDWRRIRIGGIDFDVVKPCIRCVFTTVDFERGERDPSGEPLRTLMGYRRTDKGVAFGQNLIPRGSGRLRLGAPVEIEA